MKVALGCDHAGYPLKAEIRQIIEERGHEVVDMGANSTDPVDYPDYAEAVGNAVLDKQADRGIMICGSGIGASMAANKMAGIRASLSHAVYTAAQCVEHDDANVLCLGARVIGAEVAKLVVRAFLDAEFTAEERHLRRVAKITAIEQSKRGINPQ